MANNQKNNHPPSKDKYELSLSEFPVFLLSKNSNFKNKSIIYTDTIRGNNNEIVEREWQVFPDPEYGFGSASTLETLYVLFQLWKEENFESPNIHFGTVANLLAESGKSKSARDYKRVERDLDCLVGIKIKAKNAFWDNELEAYVDMTFHLFESKFTFKEKPTGQTPLPFGFIKASSELYGSILKNSFLIPGFDRDFFLSLTSKSQRLGLLLSKLFTSQKIIKREIYSFAKQIPIQTDNIKVIKRTIKLASDELIEKGFVSLKKYYFETKKNNGEQKNFIIFERASNIPEDQKPRRGKAPETPDDTDDKFEYLVNEILSVCKDEGSTNFYRQVAKKMGEGTIFRTLGEVKETIQCGEIRRSPGSLFTHLIKKYAKEQGVDL